MEVSHDGDKGAPNPKGGSAVCDCQSYRMKPGIFRAINYNTASLT